ncbi:MAG: 4Fe-4S binding protein [Candidatus Methanofastidiosia archaeon]
MKNRKEPILLLLMLGLSVGSLIYGKLFCGYLCPFHAYDKGFTFLISKLKIKRLKTPPILKKTAVYLPLSLVLLGLIIIKASAPYTGIRFKLPVLLAAFVILTIFSQETWHRYMCPFGLISKLPALRRIGQPFIDKEQCKKCKLCKKTCPTGAITTEEGDTLKIVGTQCILCYACEDVCKYNAIKLKM